MKFIAAACLLVAGLSIYAQEKKALIFPGVGLQKTEDKTIISNDVAMVTAALNIQGFKKENISIDSVSNDKTAFLLTLSRGLQNIRTGDFLLLYFYQPVELIQPGNEAALVVNAPGLQYISLAELGATLKTAANKINNHSAFLCVFNSDLSAINTSLLNEVFKKDAVLVNSLYASQPGETSIIHNQSYLFSRAFSAAITTGSSFISTYDDLHKRISNHIILYTSRQKPALYFNGPVPAMFNNRFTKSPVYFSVKSQPGEETVIINAGQNLNILPGTAISFYPANSIDHSGKPVTLGTVTSSDELTATVKLSKPYAAKTLWAFAGLNENENPSIKPLLFNTNFSQINNPEKKKYFDAIVKSIKDDPQLDRYVQFVSAGGDLQITDIGLMSKDSISCTIANPRTGKPLKDFFYSTKSKDIIYNSTDGSRSSEVEEYIINSAEWQYLSKLQNSVPELYTEASFVDVSNKEIQKENGYPVVYENDELKLSLRNPHSKKIYFAVILMRTDKTIKLLYPGLGEEPAVYQIMPGQTFPLPSIKIPTVFGLEKLKIITSTEPVAIEELRGKNILTRKKGSSPFRPEYTNIQELNYEIRSRAYAPEMSGKKIRLQPLVNNSSIIITNPSQEKVFFNVLQLTTNGKVKILFPDKNYGANDCVIDPSGSSNLMFDHNIEKNTQLLTVFADRPFLLTDYQSEEKTINELLADIILTGRIPGSPLNKITLIRQFFTEKKLGVSRGSDIIISLLNPAITGDKGPAVPALTEEYNINGWAFTEDSMAVKMVKINGQEVDYNRAFKFFQTKLVLQPGNNKVIIEATNSKGFTETRVFEIELKKNNVNVAAKPTKYFLGIGIDDYKVWPRLNNAKNDIDNFSKVLQSKFGFHSPNIKILSDSVATRKNIINQIRDFIKKVNRNDIIIIYFSGHGNKDQLLDGDYYFIPCDADPDDVSSNVKSTDIIDPFRRLDAKHCLLIMDACYSGLITNSVNKPQISTANAGRNVYDLPSKWIITSATANKAYDGEPGTNSPFASVMLSYLKDNTDESMLTVRKLIEYLRDKVPQLNRDQMPVGMAIAGEGELTFTMDQ